MPPNMVDCIPCDVWDHVYSVQAMTGSHPGATSRTHPTERQAMSGPRAHMYEAAMQKEMDQCNEQGVWDLVETTSLKEGEVPLPCSMVLTDKATDTGDGKTTDTKTKARLVAGGHRQVEGRDYDSTWSPVVAFAILRILLAFAFTHGFIVTQVDFTGAYLNAELKGERPVFMRQHHRYEVLGPNGERGFYTCKLKKALYGLKQSGRLWHQTLTAHDLPQTGPYRLL